MTDSRAPSALEIEFLSEEILTKEHLRMIGVVAAEWSLLELALRVKIAMLLDLDPPAMAIAVTTGAGATGLVQAIENLLDLGCHDGEPDVAPLRSSLQRIKDLTSYRNEVVHSMWRREFLPPNSRRMFARKTGLALGALASSRGRQVKGVELTAEQMRQIGREIGDVRSALIHRREPKASELLAGR